MSTGKAVQSNVIPEGKAQLLYFDAAKSVPSIGGFQLNGTVELDLQGVNGRRSSTGSVHLQLPPVFSIFGGSPPTADVQLVADNTNGGPVLDNLDMRVPEAYLGAVWFTDLRFAYALHGHIDGDFNEGTSCNSKEWKAQGNMFIAGGNPRRATPASCSRRRRARTVSDSAPGTSSTPAERSCSAGRSRSRRSSRASS